MKLKRLVFVGASIATAAALPGLVVAWLAGQRAERVLLLGGLAAFVGVLAMWSRSFRDRG